ncbi:serine/threonine protein kinase [Nocardia sp. GAS34]|uniref:serine/threonine-protein kinase n=1 Tax=unclassified Nocardia TaxID=2637762 RepID=UPI003D19DCD5
MSKSLDPGDRFGQSADGTEFGAAAEFAAAWEMAAHPPEIADYLPDAQTLRLGALIDLIRVDLRHRWLRHPAGRRATDQNVSSTSPKRLYDYCSEFPELTPESLPADLVYEEFVIRRHSGERVDPRDCLREYPGHATELRGLLNADHEDQSTRRPGLAAVESSGTLSEATRTTADLTAPYTPDGLERIEIGQHIDDFDLLTELGSGAFARVFLARQRSMRRLVAVKISADRGSEPQTLAQLDHDYIVRVYDQRLLHDASAERGSRALRLLYMQFLPGGTLLNVLRWVRVTPPAERSGQLLLDAVDAAMEEKGEIRLTDSSVRDEISALSWPETVAWLGRRLAEALGYANANGVLHRDVKPANILLTAEAVPKFADFNISYNRDQDDSSPTSYFGGSLSYMSPEQLAACHPEYDRSAADLDTRSDIYSLAVVLWELLTGEKPFDDPPAAETGRSEGQMLQAMLDARERGVGADALRRLPPDCPAALRRVLLMCLESEPERRWSDGAVLAKQFELCLDPIARDLVDPPEHSWRRRLRPWRIVIVALAIIIPNASASLYNIYYNEMQVINLLPDRPRHQFAVITTLVNATLFPLGTVILVYLCRRVITVLRGLETGRAYDADTLRRARRDLLRVGEWAVIMAFSLWILSGTAFVVGLWLTAGGIPAWSATHLIASHVLCGAIATAYPFFLITFYGVRCIYPMFLHRGHVSEEDVVWLRRLNRHASLSVAIAAAVPLLTIATVTFIPISEISSVIVPVRFLSLGCIIGFVGVYAMFRSLEDDLKALVRVTDPRLR